MPRIPFSPSLKLPFNGLCLAHHFPCVHQAKGRVWLHVPTGSMHKQGLVHGRMVNQLQKAAKNTKLCAVNASCWMVSCKSTTTNCINIFLCQTKCIPEGEGGTSPLTNVGRKTNEFLVPFNPMRGNTDFSSKRTLFKTNAARN